MIVSTEKLLTNFSLARSLPAMNLAEHIADALGRKRIQLLVGRTQSAVSNAVSAGLFPASWYPVIRDECDRQGVDCPAEAFRFIQPSEPSEPAA